jgi:hypothetical protein
MYLYRERLYDFTKQSVVTQLLLMKNAVSRQNVNECGERYYFVVM